MTLGWRKLAAWLIVQAVATFMAVHIVIGGATDIPDGLLELMKWNAGFFFFGNVAVHALKGKDISITPKA